MTDSSSNDRKTSDELKDALDQLKQATDKVADKILGGDIAQHLRAAAQHVVRAARSALDQVDKKMDERAGEKAKSDATNQAP